MLLVGLFALLLSKKQNKKNSKSIEEEGGTSNLAFDEDAEQKVNLQKQCQVKIIYAFVLANYCFSG